MRLHYHQRLELDNFIMFCVQCNIAGPSNDFGWRCPVYKDALGRVEKFENPILSEDRFPNKQKSNEVFSLEECDHQPSLWQDDNKLALCTVCVQPIILTTDFGWVSLIIAEQYNL